MASAPADRVRRMVTTQRRAASAAAAVDETPNRGILTATPSAAHPPVPISTAKEHPIDARLTALLGRMLDPRATAAGLPIVDAGAWLTDETDPVARTAAAFLVVAAGAEHPSYERARSLLSDPPADVAGLDAFYRVALEDIAQELSGVFSSR